MNKQIKLSGTAILLIAVSLIAVFYWQSREESMGEPLVQMPPDFALVPIYVADINDTGYLILVNREHSIPAEPDFGLLTPAWPTVPVSFIDGMYLHPSALRAVESMLASARVADIGSFFVSSGFRGYDLQAELYNGGENSAFALPPGHSEHHTGLAADIMAVGVGQWDLGNSPQGRWLESNSYRYGLILRYPQGAEEITGIVFEPWHFRYVGRVHAYFMRRNGLVLEEYIGLLREQSGIFFQKNGITYYISHQVPENGMIFLPYGMEFTISSDNLGGYIITAWT